MEAKRKFRSWVEKSLGSPVHSIEPMAGGAGARHYARVRLVDERSVVWMQALPENPEIVPPALRRPDPALPFVAITHLLARHQLPVPVVFEWDEEERWILLEDLGSLHLCDLRESQRFEYQAHAMQLLARTHRIPRGAELPFTRKFDQAWIRFENQHFLRYAVPDSERCRLEPGMDQLAERIADLPQTLCLRDYQSQNLMIDSQGHLRLLDYQDALLAPPELDLAAFLFDSYLEIPESTREALLQLYARSGARAPAPTALALLVTQRKCKDFARFRYLVNEKHDMRFAPCIPLASKAVLAALPLLPRTLQDLAQVLDSLLRGAVS